MMDSYDCVVVGGGPAGATTAALVANAGHSTLLVERERVPGCHLGVSLMPEVRGVLERLGVWESVQAAAFGKKTGVQFVSGDGVVSQSFFFHDRDPSERSAGWNVERAAFDRILFENAGAKGAVCEQLTEARDLLLEGDRVIGLQLAAGGDVRPVRCRVLVDASGRKALLANRLGLLRRDADLPDAAVWGYYRHARRESGEHAGASVLLHAADKRSWFWCTPLAEDLSSIGVIGRRDELLTGKRKLAEIFEDELVKCPALIERLIHAELVGAFHSSETQGYSVTRWAGDGWVLVGDAAGAGDPLFGSGALLALASGAWAADAIIEGLRSRDLSAAQLGRWTARYAAGVQKIRDLARAFLSPQFNCGQLVHLHPDQKARLTSLLMGRLFDACDSPGLAGDDCWLRISPAHDSLGGGAKAPHAPHDSAAIRAAE
jgi:flavin-dependent dehydrogenase